jgi:hypothetical protein
MAYTLTQFDTLVLPAYNPTTGVGTGALQTAVLQLPGGGAFNVNQGGRSRRKVTQLSRSCTLAYDTAGEMRTAYNLLRALTGYQRRLWRVWDDGTAEWCWAVMGEIGAARGVRNNLWLAVELNWAMISEAWNGTHHGAAWTLDSGIIFDTGYVWDTTETSALTADATTAVTATNAGNRDCESLRITITAGSTKLTQVTITLTAQNCELHYHKDINAGQSLVIDTGAWTVLNNAVNAYADLELTANHKQDRWFRLAPGANALSVICAGGGAAPASTITLEYHDNWE